MVLFHTSLISKKIEHLFIDHLGVIMCASSSANYLYLLPIFLLGHLLLIDTRQRSIDSNPFSVVMICKYLPPLYGLYFQSLFKGSFHEQKF